MLDATPDTGFDAGLDATTCVATTEQCDGLVDDDCDGEIDEGCSCVDGADRACGEETGACMAGRETCVDGSYGECLDAIGPTTEVCDGTSDDDCDGNVDEGCACTDGTMQPCPSGSDVGACVAGTQRCTLGAWGVCEGSVGPATEACDGTVDEDCDGNVDEGCGCTNGTSRACGTDEGLCVAGTQRCTSGLWGACSGNVGPVTETCDGVADQDCDGRVDEGCACTNGATRACPGGTDVGTCVAGSQTCGSGNWGSCVGQVGPRTEVCDGVLDENCDGRADEGCECTNGATRACPGGTDTGACEAGTQRCSAGRWGACMGAVGPTPETCNGADDDCDGVIDGAVASAACGTAPNATVLACSAGECIVTGCLPGTDDCNDEVSDGCEIDLTLDVVHCGTCGRRCSIGQLCAVSSCSNAPLTTASQPRALDCDSCPLGGQTGDWERVSLSIAALPDGRNFVLQNYGGLADGGLIQAHAADLSVLWQTGSYLAQYNGLACTTTTCSTRTLNEAGDNLLVRIGLTGSTPTRAPVDTHSDALAPLLATPDGRWLHISSRFTRPFVSPDVSLVGPAGSVAFMGRRDIAYTTSSTRQLRATRLTGASAWTFSLPVGWTIRDGAAGVADASGVEANVYTVATRLASGRVQSRVSMVDDGGSEAEWADLVDGARDYAAEAIAIAPNGDVYVVGTRGNRGFLAVYQQDMSLIYVREAAGTAYSRFMDITFLASGEALLLGLRTAGTLTFGGSTIGSGATPPGSPNDLEADAFILRLRVE
ncbi:MAG: hypothetical protein H6720_04635 [Sandaracinus sp.]|nr:hypothetical protein [Sandaracinus sp.]